jgi:hypothetical protein
MSRLDFSSWFNFSLGRKKTKMVGAASRANRLAGRRVLHMEQLEDRQMLSVGLPAVSAVATAAIAHPAAVVASAHVGPTITNVVASATQARLTWSAADSGGVASSGLVIDGVPAMNVSGPWTATNGLNYSWPYNSLGAGTYAYVITATDGSGNATQYGGTLTIGATTGPTISKVVASPSQGAITWNAAAAGGTPSSSVSIDGATVTGIYGPWTATSGANFEGTFDAPSAGTHTYVVTATSVAGQSSQYTGWFGAGESTPTIRNVVLSAGQGLISWNAVAATGVASFSVTIDGGAVTNVSGPWTASSGANYEAMFGALPSGNHTYAITVTSGAGQSTKSVGVFAVAGPTISKVAVAAAKGLITWNAADSNGVATTALTIDGVAATSISGPYATSSGVNYAGTFGSLASGHHTYVITATDSAGRWSQYSGTFVVSNPGPTIGKVAVAAAKGYLTWNAADSDGVASTSLIIDGVDVTQILGPYKAASGVNFEGVFGKLAKGSHTYVISATDSLGDGSQYSGTFVVS